MSSGTLEFWVVDAEEHTVLVTDLRGARTYACGEVIPLMILGGGTVSLDDILTV